MTEEIGAEIVGNALAVVAQKGADIAASGTVLLFESMKIDPGAD